MDANRKTPISRADNDEAIGDFWDTHDFTDYDPGEPDVDFQITFTVPLEVELLSALEKEAKKHGVNVETLVNLWLQQKLTEQV